MPFLESIRENSSMKFHYDTKKYFESFSSNSVKISEFNLPPVQNRLLIFLTKLDLIMNIRVNDQAINDYSVDIKLFLIVLAEMLKC